MNSFVKVLLVTAFSLCAIAPTTAKADVWYYENVINDAQNNPPTGSQAHGWLKLAYNDVTHKLDADIYFEGIRHEDLLYSHLHYGRAGYYGDMVVHLGMGHEFHEEGNGLRHTMTGMDVDPNANFALITDGTYVAVHTIQFPAGEIRGQAVVRPRFSADPMIRGQQATLTVTRANRGDRVYFLYSMNSLGGGRSIGALGGLTLDLLEPVITIGSAVADQSGRASLTLTVPGNAPPFPVYLQAVIRRGANGEDSVKSNTISTAILP